MPPGDDWLVCKEESEVRDDDGVKAEEWGESVHFETCSLGCDNAADEFANVVDDWTALLRR